MRISRLLIVLVPPIMVALSATSCLPEEEEEEIPDHISFASFQDSHAWVCTWGGYEAHQEPDDCGACVAIGPDGSVFVTGSFDGETDFNPREGKVVDVPRCFSGIYLSKFDAGGNYEWTQTWSSTEYISRGRAVRADGSGNTYVLGVFNGTMDLDPGRRVDGHRSRLGEPAAFLVALDPSGDYRYGTTWGDVEVADLVVDADGNAFVAGHFPRDWDFEPDRVNIAPHPKREFHKPVGSSDAWLAKLNTDGELEWLVTWGAEYRDNAQCLAIGGSGRICVSGKFRGGVDFDPGPEISVQGASSTACYASCFSPDGQHIFSCAWGSEEVSSIAADGADNVFAAGYFWFEVDFDPGPGTAILDARWEATPYLVKFGSDGAFQWVRSWGMGDMRLTVAAAESGEAYVAGSFRGRTDFDPGNGTNAVATNGGTDVFVAKYEAGGDYQGVVAWGGKHHDCVLGITGDDSGSIYVAGWFNDVVDFDPAEDVAELESNGGTDAFLVKLTDSMW